MTRQSNMTDATDCGRVAASGETGSHASRHAASGVDGPSGFDPARNTLEDYMAEIDAGKAGRCDWCVGFIRRDCDMFKRCVKQATDRSFS